MAAHTAHPARLVIADDHPVVRHGVCTVLAHAAAPGYSVVAEAGDPAGAMQAVQRFKPDLLLLDVSMSPGSGLDVLERCCEAHPDLAAVVYTMHREVELVRRAVTAGARGYVLKDAPASELLVALRLAHRGATYLPSGMARSLTDSVSSVQPSELSSRECAVLRLIALGYTGAGISSELRISERTVKNYRAAVADKLGLHQRHELTQWALQHGLVTQDHGPPYAAADECCSTEHGRESAAPGRSPALRASTAV